MHAAEKVPNVAQANLYDVRRMAANIVNECVMRKEHRGGGGGGGERIAQTGKLEKFAGQG